MYIWENYTPSKKFYVGKENSPYIEILNDTKNIIEVNPLLRFGEIFAELDKIKSILLKTQDFENILFHYLALLDTLKGLDRKQIFLNYIDKEIQEGEWGEFVKQKWAEIQPNHKEVLLHTLYEQKDNANNFFEVIKKLFDVASLLYEKSTETYYLYFNDNLALEYCKTLIEVVKFLFWDIQNHLEVVWKNHYGIIGFEETMKISEINIV